MWDEGKFEISAVIKKNGKLVSEMPLRFSGRPSLFTGSFDAREKGSYELIVYAYDPSNGNTGVDRTSFTVR